MLVGLPHAYSLGGSTDKAQLYIGKAAELQPNNERLKLLRVRYGDPIEGVKIYTARTASLIQRSAMR